MRSPVSYTKSPNLRRRDPTNDSERRDLYEELNKGHMAAVSMQDQEGEQIATRINTTLGMMEYYDKNEKNPSKQWKSTASGLAATRVIQHAVSTATPSSAVIIHNKTKGKQGGLAPLEYYHLPKQEHADLVDTNAQLGDLHTDTSPTFAGVTVGNTGLHILDTNASHDLIIKPGSDLTADRTLTLTTGNADRIITLSGNLTVESASLVNQDLTSDASPTFDDLTISTPVNIYALSHDAFADFAAAKHYDWTNETHALVTTGNGTFGALGVNDGATPDLVTYDVDFASSGTLAMQLYGAGGGTAGNLLESYRKSASPAISDRLLTLSAYGDNDAGTPAKIRYARVQYMIADETEDTEDGQIQFAVAAAGTPDTTILTLDASGANVVGTVQVSGTQVLTSQQAAIADLGGAAPWAPDGRNKLNAILAMLRVHGIIAT